MNKVHLISLLLLASFMVGCTSTEELNGFWKVEQVLIWNADASIWQEDVTAPKLYTQFKVGDASCPQGNGTAVRLIPPLTCYSLEGDQLLNSGEGGVERQWKVEGGKLEITTQFTNAQGKVIKIKAISSKATQQEAQQDGFPYMRTATVKVVEE